MKKTQALTEQESPRGKLKRSTTSRPTKPTVFSPRSHVIGVSSIVKRFDDQWERV